jgi:hypothetical protein
VPDILGQGGDRPPRRWPRWLAGIAVAAAAAAVIALHLPRHAPPPAPHPSARHPAAASAAPGAPQDQVAGGITGPTLPWDASLRLPVAGARPAWFSPATGATSPIGGLPRDRSGYQFIRISGGWVIQAGQPAPDLPACDSCAGPPLPVYYLGDRARAVTRVGVASAVAPGSAAGTIWLTSYPADANLASVAGLARKVSVAGLPQGPPVRLPVGQAIAAGTDRGLLLAPAIQAPGPATDELWRPGGPSQTFTGVIATSATQVAWVPRCAAACQVRVLDLVTGRRTAITLPASSSAADAAFSPDGGFLAVELTLENNGDDGALAAQLDVAAMATGRLAVVPATFVSSDAMAGFGWPAAGDTLIAELSFTARVQVASWHPGAARLAVAAVRPGPDSSALVVG